MERPSSIYYLKSIISGVKSPKLAPKSSPSEILKISWSKYYLAKN